MMFLINNRKILPNTKALTFALLTQVITACSGSSDTLSTTTESVDNTPKPTPTVTGTPNAPSTPQPPNEPTIPNEPEPSTPTPTASPPVEEPSPSEPVPTAPHFVTSVPSRNALAVDINTPIEFHFTEEIQARQVAGLIRLNIDNREIATQENVVGNTYQLVPENHLPFGSRITVIVNEDLGSQLHIPFTEFSFTTANRSVASNFCTNHYSEDFALVTGQDNTTITSTPKPQKGTEFTDPTYGTCVIRATDANSEGPEGFARNDYSRRQAFNADNSYFFVYALNGFWHLYDGTDLSYVKQLSGPAADAEMQWHPSDPNIFYYTPNLGGLVVYEYDITTDTTRTTGDFSGRLPWSNAARVWTKSEGSPSADARYWGFQVETANFTPLGLMVWDREEDEIISTWDFSENGVGRPDHVSMSPSGEYIVASWDGNAFGTTAFSRDFSQQIKLHHKSEHSDIALLPNGNDAYVSVDYQTGGGDVFLHEIQRDKRTVLFPSYVNGTGTAFHFSGKGFNKPGWILVSTYGNSAPQQWLHQKIYAVELKENPRILNIAHHHVESNGYWTEPHASVNRDFTRILFNSNWETGEANDVDAYMVVLATHAIPLLIRPSPHLQIPLQILHSPQVKIQSRLTP